MRGRAQEHQVNYAVEALNAAFVAEENRSPALPVEEVDKALLGTMQSMCTFASDHLIACKRSSGLSDPAAGWEERTWGADYTKDSVETRTYMGMLDLLLIDAETDKTSYLCLVQHFEVLVDTGAPIPQPLAQFIARTLRQPHVAPRLKGKPPLPVLRNKIIHDLIQDVAQALDLRPTRGDEVSEKIVSACDVVAEAMARVEQRPSNPESIRKIWYQYRSHLKREKMLDTAAEAELDRLIESPEWDALEARFSAPLPLQGLQPAQEAPADPDVFAFNADRQR